MSIMLTITKTCRHAGGIEPVHYYRYDNQVKYFPDIQAAKEWIKSEYSDCKRSKMYRDGKNGHPEHIGYIYHYKSEEYDYGKRLNYYCQDWIELSELNTPKGL